MNAIGHMPLMSLWNWVPNGVWRIAPTQSVLNVSGMVRENVWIVKLLLFVLNQKTVSVCVRHVTQGDGYGKKSVKQRPAGKMITVRFVSATQ